MHRATITLLMCLGAAACAPGAPPAQGPISIMPGAPDAAAPAAPAHDAAPRPVATPVPLGPGDRACASDADCREHERCSSPEGESWNFCGAPRAPRCAPGYIGDSCGHCFVACAADADCDPGFTCGGTFCTSPSRCSVPKPPPP